MPDNVSDEIAGDRHTISKAKKSIADAEQHLADSVDKLAESQKLLRRVAHET